MFQQLKQSKDFLALTLAHPQYLTESFEFDLANQVHVEVWDTGVIMFEPLGVKHTKDLVLSCAVHGNETAPIELCNDLMTQLLDEQLVLKQRVLFLIGNPPAIHNGTRFIDENLNRLFNGAHSRGEGLCNPERVRAQKLEQYVDKFFSAHSGERHRMHYDLHTAIRASKHEKFAIYPYRGNRKYSKEQIMFLESCGVNTILFHHEPTTTFSYFSSENYHADAFTIELGKVFPMGQNDMTRFIAMKEMLTLLMCGEELKLPSFDMKRLNLYQVCRSVNKRYDDFEFTFTNDVENFTAFPRGYTLAKEGGFEVKVEHEFESIVFPNAKVPVGQRTVLCLKSADESRLD
ncbi:succinylglutamate desuccinylase [Shewanella pealeana]|uniref:Succinylglutamate desuccinylase n=1 Tax=Shewanella pealeana (strain ATCC 700345 / ANG-SQ1) TaxID=398579 RepID=ASTE_SHEPA|nr:succinylglutamate desuccinylase [Shewanella pealeana]A8H4T0.1 RecName: Full=Succinylglutamate desuccinylase [Shewanella pealeana ATCC 700345]ABV87567.1 Succinylglutamate desuccinylase/aspartoacylase [Shewanella pealeana ATCC 700345]